jgi:hypothetical protein
MATHALTQIGIHTIPLFSLPTTRLKTPGIPHWHQLDPDLQQTLVALLTQMIGDHLPRASARDGRGVADDSR